MHLADIIACSYFCEKKSSSVSIAISNCADVSSMYACLLQVNVQQRFQKLADLLAEHYTEEDQQIVACPRPEQVSTQLRIIAITLQWYLFICMEVLFISPTEKITYCKISQKLACEDQGILEICFVLKSIVKSPGQ